MDKVSQFRVMTSLSAQATWGANALLVAGFVGSLLVAPLPSLAAITLRVEQIGDKVVVTGSGSANLTALSSPQQDLQWSNYINDLEVYVGPSVAATGNVGLYSGLTGPLIIGSDPTTFEIPDITGSTGDLFGILADDGMGQSFLVLPDGYQSGNSLAGVSTYSFMTLAKLGLTPGQVNTWNWGTGPDADSLRLEVHGTTPVPAPAPLLGVLAAYRTARNLKRRQRARSLTSTKIG